MDAGGASESMIDYCLASLGHYSTKARPSYMIHIITLKNGVAPPKVCYT